MKLVKFFSTVFITSLCLYIDPAIAGQAISGKVDSILNRAQTTCTASGAAFTYGTDAVKIFDFDSDNQADLTIVDSSKFRCSYSASFFQGSGGSVIHLLTQYDHKKILARSHKIINLENDEPVILLRVHGANCNASGHASCWMIYSVFNGKILSAK